MSENRVRVLNELDTKQWKARKTIAKDLEISLAGVARILNRFEAMGCVECADPEEHGREVINHYRITKEGLKLRQRENSAVVTKSEHVDAKADMRSKLYHVKDEIDKVLTWLNQS